MAGTIARRRNGRERSGCGGPADPAARPGPHDPRSTIAAVDNFVILIVLIWRGPKTLPQIGAMLGRGVRGARQEADKLRATGGPTDPSEPDQPSGSTQSGPS